MRNGSVKHLSPDRPKETPPKHGTADKKSCFSRDMNFGLVGRNLEIQSGDEGSDRGMNTPEKIRKRETPRFPADVKINFNQTHQRRSTGRFPTTPFVATDNFGSPS